MTQAGVVARLAVRELWISFRLFAIVAAFTAAGALVALVPAPLPVTVGRLSVGLGAATLVASGVTAWSLADERRDGRAGWLVTRSLSRPTLLLGWFIAVAIVSLIALVGAMLLGWLAATSVTLRLEPTGYLALAAGVAASALLAVAIGLLAGALLAPRAAVVAAVTACVAAAAIAALAPVDPSLVPGGAYVALAALVEPGSSAGPGLRVTGVALAATGVVLVLARAVIERADL